MDLPPPFRYSLSTTGCPFYSGLGEISLRTRVRLIFGIVASAIWFFDAVKTASVTPPQTPVKKVDFNRDIRPILSDTCFKCHGPDENQRMANLRLDDTEGLFVDRGGYRIIVPGNAAQSKLYQKISSTDDSFRMPPTYSGRSLTPKQIELMKEWIDQGAKWDMLWSFVPPKRPPVPEVKDKAWPRNSIDNFVLARLEAEGLKPSPEADRATLLRRVYFDLTGLPPTPAEIDSFLADRSPDAYEKRVDQLLASPHYGERMAMPWLDMARYSDTHGYHIDSLRDMWAWRDWVIKAFNQNMPYDEFITEQVAGDLLPNATMDQKIASGFNRTHDQISKAAPSPLVHPAWSTWSIASAPPRPPSWASPWAARAATTTNSTRSRRRIFIASSLSSTRCRSADWMAIQETPSRFFPCPRTNSNSNLILSNRRLPARLRPCRKRKSWRSATIGRESCASFPVPSLLAKG